MIDDVDDRQLMLRFQEEGDPSTFTVLFERHKSGLKAFLTRLAANGDVAEEISQRVWLKVLEVAERGAYTEKSATFRTWLFTVARNTYLDEYRKNLTRETQMDEEPSTDVASASDPAGEAESRQMRDALNRAVADLPSEQREVIAFWAAGLEMDLIAQIVGVSPHTVIGRKRYAMNKLRHALRPVSAETAS